MQHCLKTLCRGPDTLSDIPLPHPACYTVQPRSVSSIINIILLVPLVPRGVVVVQIRFRSQIKDVTIFFLFFCPSPNWRRAKIACLNSPRWLSEEGNNGYKRSLSLVRKKSAFWHIYFCLHIVCLICVVFLWSNALSTKQDKHVLRNLEKKNPSTVKGFHYCARLEVCTIAYPNRGEISRLW